MSQAAADALVAEAHELFRAERYADAAARFERAVTVFPQHALGWKGLGHALLCMARPHEAARAFDQAIGLRPDSATALWGGALAHADIGNKVVAQNYLRRTLALQPSWLAMAQAVPQLAGFLQVSTHAAELLQRAFGAFSKRSYRHAADDTRSIEVGRIANQPAFGQWTFVTVGLSNATWKEPERPRVELVLGSTIDLEVCGKILANLAFHLTETGFFPQPGTMVRDVVGALAAGELSQRLPHVYVQSPRAWHLELPLDEGPPAITLAQVFPISDTEYQTWRRLGPDRFEQALVDRRIDVTDLRRRGV
ncbi:MAG: suppressor of fused domain protein [Acidobacteriota bacterium]